MSESLLVHTALCSSAVLGLLWLRAKKAKKYDGTQYNFQLGDYDPTKISGMKFIVPYTEEFSGRRAIHLILGPNHVFPDHVHVSPEWCYLVKGSISDNFGNKTAPCLFYNEKFSPHYDVRAGPEGCELLIVKDKGDNIPMEKDKCWCDIVSNKS